MEKKKFWPFGTKKKNDLSSVLKDDEPVVHFNLIELNEFMAHAKQELASAMIASVIAYIDNGAVIVKNNCDDAFGEISAQIISFLKTIAILNDLPLGRYMFCGFEESASCVFIIIDEYVWSVVIDTSKMSLDMFTNIYLDGLIEEFRIAIA